MSRPAKFAYWRNRFGTRSYLDFSDEEKRIVLAERGLYHYYHRAAWLEGDDDGR